MVFIGRLHGREARFNTKLIENWSRRVEITLYRRSQWSRGLRHEMASLQFPLKAYVYGHFFVFCKTSNVRRTFYIGLPIAKLRCVLNSRNVSKDSCRLCAWFRNWESGQDPKNWLYSQ
jgi:hypothetical protein